MRRDSHFLVAKATLLGNICVAALMVVAVIIWVLESGGMLGVFSICTLVLRLS